MQLQTLSLLQSVSALSQCGSNRRLHTLRSTFIAKSYQRASDATASRSQLPRSLRPNCFRPPPSPILVAAPSPWKPKTFGKRLRQRPWTVVPDFTHHAHTASLSAVAVNNRYVVTGSRDETIQIYDMKKKVEHGALLQHNGTITCLEFYGTSHLLSGAEDGLICIWNTKRWECLKSIKAHKGHVTSISIHPSGKLALSVGTDKTLRTWNLVEGRPAFIKNLKQNAHIIKWSPDGERYVTVISNKVDIYRLDTASITGTITTEKRISSLRFITDSILAIAGDDETVRFYSCDSQKCLCEFKAHENRIKDIYSFEREGQHLIVTASSDGYIKVWNLDLNKIKDAPSLLCEVNTKARLTCLAVWLDQGSELKENCDKTATSSQANEDEKSSIVRKKKVCRTDRSDKTVKTDRKITPKKRKLETPLQKKKKKHSSSE